MSKIPETREEVKEYVKELPDSVEPIFCKTPDEVPTQNHGNTITTQPEDKSFSIIILKDVLGFITAVWIVAAHIWPQWVPTPPIAITDTATIFAALNFRYPYLQNSTKPPIMLVNTLPSGEYKLGVNLIIPPTGVPTGLFPSQ